MFAQLIKAVLLQGDFQQSGMKSRAMYLMKLSLDLAERSGVAPKLVETEQALEAKLYELERAHREYPSGYVVYWTETRVRPLAHKTDYKREGDAKRQALKLSGRQPGSASYASYADYAKAGRMVLRSNMMSKKLYLEAQGTPGFCSPSSEAYWSM